MRSGTWDGAVSTDNVRVTVNGIIRPVKSVKVQSGMRDGHPRSDTDSWCVEATIEWEDPNKVTSDSPHLFGTETTEWLPKAGDRVVVESGDGALGQWWVQHRGVIDDTTGSISEGTAKSTTVDNIEDLQSRVQFGALLHQMTPWSDVHDYRWIGLSSLYMVDRMYRNPQTEGIGWYATPPATWQTVASATHIGSCWPEIGTLRICTRSYTEQNTQIRGWRNTSYGVAPYGLYAETLFAGSAQEVILTVSAEQSSSGSCRWRIQDSNGYGPFVTINGSTGNIEYGHITTGTQRWTLPIGNAKRVALYFRRDTTTQQTMVLRTDDGREVTRTGTSGQYPNGWAADRVWINTNDYGQAGWWMVEGAKPSSQRWSTLNHQPTARLRRFADVRWLASRDLPFTEPAGWLQEQVDAECAAMWLDEDNHMQWVSRGVLDNQAPVMTYTSVRDIEKIDWEQRRRALARGVWVNFESPEVRSLLGGFRQNCWENDSIDLAPGESETIIAQIPEDEDWISVDLDPVILTQWTQPSWLRNGSKFGGTQYTETASGETGQTWAQFVDCTMTRMGLRNISVYYAPWRTLGNVRVKSAIPDLNADNAPSASLAAWHSGKAALRIRSRAKTVWVDGERSLQGGEIGQARFTHDAGWRVQNMHIVDGVGELLSWLAVVVRESTKPWITGITIAHDPRLQIGDTIRIRDTAVTGIDFDMVVQDRDADLTEMVDTIKGRVTAVRTLYNPGPSNRDWTTRTDPIAGTPTTPARDWTREVTG